MDDDAVISCIEEEFAPFFFALWRIRQGWRWLPIYFRGPGFPGPLLGLLFTLVGIWRFARKPARLVDLTNEVFLPSSIVKTCTTLGSYGMGSPGFFGLKCRKGIKTFWIVFILSSADSWLTLNGNLLESSLPFDGEREQYAKRGLISQDAMVGGKLTSVSIQHDLALLQIQKDHYIYELELRRDGSAVPPHRNPIFGKKVFGDDERIADAIIISRKADLWME